MQEPYDIADGVLPFLCPIPYVLDTALPALREGAAAASRPRPPIIAHVPVALTEDRATALQVGRQAFTAHTTYPFYRKMFVAAGGKFHHVITTLISKMISSALPSHGLCQLYFSQYGTQRPTMGGESKSHDESTGPDEAANTRATCRGDSSGMRSLWAIAGTHYLHPPGRKA